MPESSRLTRSLLIAVLALLPLSAAPAVGGNAKPLDLDEVGAGISVAFNERDADTLVTMMDMQALGRRVAVTLFESEKARSEFAQGFASSVPGGQVISQLFAALDSSEGSSTKYMKVVRRGDELRPLMRMDYGDDGFDYLEFVIHPDDRGRPRIVDWSALSNGELYSESLGSITRLAIDPAPGLIPGFLGFKQVDEKAIGQFKRIGELRTRGELQKAYEEMGRLPAEFADTRVLLVQRASLASEMGNEDAYRAMLARLAEKHGRDPAAAFMLVDHYFYAKDLRKFLGAIEAIEGRVGDDGLMQLLRSNMYGELGMLDEAIAHAAEAIRREPDLETAYFSLAQWQVLAGQFGEAIGVYRRLEADFDYAFSEEVFREDARYRDFLASPELKEWLKD